MSHVVAPISPEVVVCSTAGRGTNSICSLAKGSARMKLESLIALAKEQGASDLHLEPGLPLGLRVRGALRMSGEAIPGAATMSAARELLSPEPWSPFQ